MREYGNALEKINRCSEIDATRPIPGSFDALCVSYYRSPEFLGLAASTRQQRRNILENFRALHGNKPLKGLGRAHIKEILAAKASTPEAANHLLKVLSGILNYAVDEEMLSANPAYGIKKLKSQGDGHHTWSEAEIAQFQKRHPLGSKAALALALGLYTAQRKGDCIRMGWQDVNGDSITVRQQKTGTPLVLELHPELKAVLASMPRTNLTFLVTEWGAPFSAAGFGNWFRDRCNEAGLRHCSFHGLRKAAATRLANAGCSINQIKAVTGHKKTAELEKYTKAADQRQLARQALATQLGAEGEQNCPTIDAPLSNRKAK
jgi:integrase